jgi:hypothetical protein
VKRNRSEWLSNEELAEQVRRVEAEKLPSDDWMKPSRAKRRRKRSWLSEMLFEARKNRGPRSI